MKDHKFRIYFTLCFLLLWSNLAVSSNLCSIARGAYVIAQDGSNTFLGIIENKFNAKSIFNDYGDYGSKYASDSIWNEYGSFGGKYGMYSPFNNMSINPPMVIKENNIIGYLSSNKTVANSVNPSILKAMCEDEL
ncbi:hypothetical protein [Aeromonas sp. D3]|uniref:hypothetical protein n=1 Tax=Aeromonas sp. D3 TaxID=2990474 RepID=UPI0022E17159|nr:hypothetical protein [Aeromonas sp. D3]